MRIAIIILVFLSSILGAMEPEPKKLHSTKHVNVVLIFEEGGKKSKLTNAFDKKYKPDAVILTLFNAIDENQILLISSPILKIIFESFTKADEKDFIYNLKKNNWVKKSEYLREFIEYITLNYTIRVNPTNDFILLIPNKILSKGETFSSLGFDEKNLSEFDRSENLLAESVINIENFKKFFNPEYIIKNYLKYIFYLGGHGDSKVIGFKKTSFAQMDLEQYKLLLNFINPYTDFFYIISCYAGGSNISELSQKQIDTTKEYFALEQLQFIFAMGATSDNPAMGGSIDFRAYFDELTTYFKTKNLKYLKNALQIPFKIHKLFNIPSIRFPGNNSFFRVIELDKDIKAITLTQLKAHELAAKKIEQKLLPYSITANIALLLYPGFITIPISLNIKSPEARIISMINGNALHIFTKIETNLTFENVLQLFTQPETSLTKSFFIKELYCSDAQLENVFLGTYPGERYPNLEKIFIYKVKEGENKYKDLKGKYIQKIMSKNIGTSEPWKDQHTYEPMEDTAVTSIIRLARNSMPEEEALMQATGGQQTQSLLFKNLQKLLLLSKSTLLPFFPEKRTITISDIKQQAQKREPLELSNIQLISFSPALISLPIKISYNLLSPEQKESVSITSLIEGKAIHIFNDLSIDTSLPKFVKSLKGFQKIFFIKKLYCASGIFENVLIQTQMLNPTIIFKIISLKSPVEKVYNNYYLTTLRDIKYETWERLKPISKEEALSAMAKRLADAMPIAENLAKATGGQQTKELVQKAVQEILKSLL